MLAFVVAVAVPLAAHAQNQWTGIGAIRGTAMFMDTTSIRRVGTIASVWIRSLDSTPRQFVTGRDTITFDTVIGLNEFDCSHGTRAVGAVRYMLGDEVVFEVPVTHDPPAIIDARSFFGAIYRDLCRSVRQ